MHKHSPCSIPVFLFHLIIFASICYGTQDTPNLLPAFAKGEFFFTIQVLSHANKNQALVIAENFLKKGYPAYIHEVLDNQGQRLYRVRIGKFKTRSEAKKLARLITEQEKTSCWVSKVESLGDTTTQVMAEDYRAQTGDVPETKQELPESADIKNPGNELPLEPDPGSTEPPAADEKTKTVTDSQTEKSDHGQNAWPESVSKIYTYRGSGGAVNLTNTIEKIPDNFQDSIENITIFPVRFVTFIPAKEALLLEIEGRRQRIKLVGIAYPPASHAERLLNYFTSNLQNIPLRLKYNPNKSSKEGTILGTLYSKENRSVNLALVRQGIAACFMENVPSDQQKAFAEAEASARSKKAGIWANE